MSCHSLILLIKVFVSWSFYRTVIFSLLSYTLIDSLPHLHTAKINRQNFCYSLTSVKTLQIGKGEAISTIKINTIFKRWDLGSYSLTSVSGKVIEHVLLEIMLRHVKIWKWLLKLGWVHSGQISSDKFGPSYGGIMMLVDNGRATDVISMDLRRAFDTVLCFL